MDIDSFRDLIEIQGLKNRQENHRKSIDSEQLRPQRILIEEESSKDKLNRLNADITQQKTEFEAISSRLSKLESGLPRLRENLMQAKTHAQMQSLEASVTHDENEIARFTEKALFLLQKLDEDEKEALRLRNFLNGLKKSYEEILLDSKLKIEQEQKEIQNYQVRIDSLFLSVPGAKEIILNCWEKNRQAIVTVNDQGNCECGMRVSRNLSSQIEAAREIITCSSCGRIFMPYKAYH